MSSASISSLFPQAQSSIFRVQHQLSEYESGANTSQPAELSIQQTLDSLQRMCGEMDQAANNEGTRREMWKQRVRGLTDEVSLVRTSFTRAQKQNPHSAYSQQASAAATRSALFSTSTGMSTGGRAQASAVDSFVRQNDSLGRSHRMMDDLHDMGTKALESLRAQRGTLKGVRRKAMDVANLLGLSGSLTKMIAREDRLNAWITYACMVFSVIVVIIVWWYFR